MCHVNDQPGEHPDLGSASPSGTRSATDLVRPQATGPDAEPPGPPAARRRRRLDRGLLIASGVIALALIVMVWGLLGAVTGSEGIDRPEAIEELTPVENAIQVLQQEPVIVDLQFGYEAELTIDGITLPTTTIGEVDVEPGEQLTLPPTAIFDPGNSIISFQPVDGALIETFSAGTHRVRLVYWRIDEGRAGARSYTWTFNAV